MTKHTEPTPTAIQAAILRDVAQTSGIRDWSDVIAYARTFIPELPELADYDLRGPRDGQHAVNGQEYTSGAELTLWLGDTGVMITTDSTTPEGRRWAKGYAGLVTWS